MNRAIKITRLFMYLSAAVLFSCLSYQAIYMPKLMEPRISQLVDRLEARDEQVRKLLKHADDVMEDNYWTTKANIETTAVILRDVSEITRQIRTEVMPELPLTVRELRALTVSLKEDISDLSASGSEALLASAELIRKLDRLTEGLEVQIRDGSPRVFQTLEHIDSVIVDIDKQVSNPDLYAIANNVKEITGSTAEIAKTTDIATRPLREKAKLIKIILLRLAGMIRIQPF